MRIMAGLLLLFAALAPAQVKQKLSASAIQIDLVEVGDVSIPAEFRYAIYERLIERVRESGAFQKVFRSGDQEAKNIPDLVTLHTSVEAFQEGSQMQRELAPVVIGNTTVNVSARVTAKDGKTLLDQKVAGKVRIFGENLGATNDLAKRITKLLRENF
jgi:hypothetical protein